MMEISQNQIGLSFLDLQSFLLPCVQFIENQRHCGVTPNTLEGIIRHSDCPVDSPLLSQTPSFPHFHHFHFLMTLTTISIICLLCFQVSLTSHTCSTLTSPFPPKSLPIEPNVFVKDDIFFQWNHFYFLKPK